MRKDTPILTPDKALAHACGALEDALSLHAEGTKCQSADLIRVLVAMVSQGMTLEQACASFEGTPHPTTVRKYLNTQLTLERLPQVEAEVNAALQAQLPPRLWRRALDVAIDLHDQPYYGRSTQEEGKWIKGQKKAGTRRAYRIASTYVMRRGQRFTLGVAFMPHGVTPLAALKTLLQQVQQLGLKVKCLWMDRGFASVDIMRYLDAQGWRAVIGCPIRGKPTGKGTRALCNRRGSYVTQHTFENHQRDQTYTAKLAICRVFRNTGPRSRQRRKADWEIYILINVSFTPQQVRHRYPHRFGIETSYRCANQVRAWTTSPNVAYRLLLLALALFLYNVWVYLMYCYTQVARKGGRYLDTQQLRLARLKHMLLHALEDYYGAVLTVTAPAVAIL